MRSPREGYYHGPIKTNDPEYKELVNCDNIYLFWKIIQKNPYRCI